MTDERTEELKNATIQAIDALPDKMTRWELARFFMATLYMYDITGDGAATVLLQAATEVENVNASAHAQVAIRKAQQENTDQ